MTMSKLMLAALIGTSMATPAFADATNVVLVHGATMDASGWRPVYDILRAKGLKVSAVQLPHTSLADDITATRLILKQQKGPTVLVGHSYGGAVITEAGTEEVVKALVYVAALEPDKGENLTELSQRYPMKIDMEMLDAHTFVPSPATYHDTIAADLPKDVTDFMSASSKPMTVETYQERFNQAAWHEKPSFGIVTTEDRVIPPELLRWTYERAGTKTTDIKSSHMVYMSHPQETADVILQAVKSVN
ncbi:pimeloyl-ACP methyl ester carboxylesterase [Phyllobacterium myrsinacearum]|nr:pimeloyl-ACP methyl ester carboxylesterase [Phyllobacterium myrsinacearum]RZS76740.1 pimeloyl-ACP methyl ester carboxylesterase [Phyllobacterium myrsinacearum]RZU96950.1 pimeloyl-ACP methyl ester carboxylesterase [Phyllobacterium myrsinacearum]